MRWSEIQREWRLELQILWCHTECWLRMVEEKESTGRSRASGLCEGGSGPGGTIESSTIKGPSVGRLPIDEGCSRPQHNCRDELFKYGSEGDFHTEFLHLLCRTEICDSKKAAQLGGKVGAESQGLPRALGFTFPVYAEESWSPAWKEPPGVILGLWFSNTSV